jgi:hypothetical protein
LGLQPLVDAPRDENKHQGGLYADETPVQMISPPRARRIAEHYKTSFPPRAHEIGCAADGSRRRFPDLLANHSNQFCGTHAAFVSALRDIKRDGAALILLRDIGFATHEQALCDTLHEWLTEQRKLGAECSSIAHALEHSVDQKKALLCSLNIRSTPIDSTWIEHKICPWSTVNAVAVFQG